MICIAFPTVTEDIKWGNNLVFSVAEKMFCLTNLNPPLSIAFKVPEEEFDELAARSGINQAPHFAKRKWILVTDPELFTREEWIGYLKQSYELVVAKLPNKTREQLGK